VSNELRPACQAADAISSSFKLAQQAAAHIPGGSGYEDKSIISNTWIIHTAIKDVLDKKEKTECPAAGYV
jgi:hypothetical protein